MPGDAAHRRPSSAFLRLHLVPAGHWLASCGAAPALDHATAPVEDFLGAPHHAVVRDRLEPFLAAARNRRLTPPRLRRCRAAPGYRRRDAERTLLHVPAHVERDLRAYLNSLRGRSAPPPRRVSAARLPSQATSDSSTGSASSSAHRAAGPSCGSEPPSSTDSLTSAAGKDAALAPTASARTSSNPASPALSRTSKRSCERPRDEIPFKQFGVLDLGARSRGT